MRARAPGKLVLSGAYAVLRGAPAIVCAVDRYAVADTTARPEFVTPEVEAALEALGYGSPPSFDASALRGEREKLGLGSSAAILVASLGALCLERGTPPEKLADAVFPIAVAAHRKAQGGGSGIDVAAAAHGGTLLARRANDELEVRQVSLPDELHVEAWVMGHPASTREFVARVFALEADDPRAFTRLLDAQIAASVAAEEALLAGDAEGLLGALGGQHEALFELGQATATPIVTPEVRYLQARAMPSAVVLPSGAGGGDVSLHVGFAPSSDDFRAHAERRGLRLLPLTFGADGVAPA